MPTIKTKIKRILLKFLRWLAITLVRTAIVLAGYFLWAVIKTAEIALLALSWIGDHFDVQIQTGFEEVEEPDFTAKFQPEDIEAMARDIEKGSTLNEISDRFGISYRQAASPEGERGGQDCPIHQFVLSRINREYTRKTAGHPPYNIRIISAHEKEKQSLHTLLKNESALESRPTLLSKLIQMKKALLLLAIAFVLAGCTYQPEDLTDAPVLREFVFNQCEKYPDQAHLFRGNPTVVYTNPQKSGMTGRLESCLGWTVKVYREEIHDGEKWLLFQSGDIQGWQRASVME